MFPIWHGLLTDSHEVAGLPPDAAWVPQPGRSRSCSRQRFPIVWKHPAYWRVPRALPTGWLRHQGPLENGPSSPGGLTTCARRTEARLWAEVSVLGCSAPSTRCGGGCLEWRLRSSGKDPDTQLDTTETMVTTKSAAPTNLETPNEFKNLKLWI